MADPQFGRSDFHAPDLKVRAVAGQFQWSFDYLPADAQFDTKPLFTVSSPEGPDGGLFLPAGQTTHLFLRSPDVIHAFYVPQFLFKRDVVPGITNQFDLQIPASDAVPAKMIIGLTLIGVSLPFVSGFIADQLETTVVTALRPIRIA